MRCGQGSGRNAAETVGWENIREEAEIGGGAEGKTETAFFEKGD